MRSRRRGLGLPFEEHRKLWKPRLDEGFSEARLAENAINHRECQFALGHLMDAHGWMKAASSHVFSAVDQNTYSPQSVMFSFTKGQVGELNKYIRRLSTQFKRNCMCKRRKR